jgi:hypothetical protein
LKKPNKFSISAAFALEIFALELERSALRQAPILKSPLASSGRNFCTYRNMTNSQRSERLETKPALLQPAHPVLAYIHPLGGSKENFLSSSNLLSSFLSGIV